MEKSGCVAHGDIIKLQHAPNNKYLTLSWQSDTEWSSSLVTKQDVMVTVAGTDEEQKRQYDVINHWFIETVERTGI